MKNIFSVFISLLAITSLSGQARFTDPRDGNIYKTITVNGVIWMAENLKYKAPGREGAFCFDHDTNNLPHYGLLYDWKSATQVCPAGWHLPSGKEFYNLVNHFDHDQGWEKKGAGPNTFGIQLAGMQDYEGTFTEMDESAYYWTSTEYSRVDAEYFSYLLLNNTPAIDISRKEDVEEIHGTEKTNKYSVRCVKD